MSSEDIDSQCITVSQVAIDFSLCNNSLLFRYVGAGASISSFSGVGSMVTFGCGPSRGGGGGVSDVIGAISKYIFKGSQQKFSKISKIDEKMTKPTMTSDDVI